MDDRPGSLKDAADAEARPSGGYVALEEALVWMESLLCRDAEDVEGIGELLKSGSAGEGDGKERVQSASSASFDRLSRQQRLDAVFWELQTKYGLPVEWESEFACTEIPVWKWLWAEWSLCKVQVVLDVVSQCRVARAVGEEESGRDKMLSSLTRRRRECESRLCEKLGVVLGPETSGGDRAWLTFWFRKLGDAPDDAEGDWVFTGDGKIWE